MKKIDVHTHVTMFPDITPKRPGDGENYLTVEKQLKVFDDVNTQIGVLLPLVSPECQWAFISNQEAKTIADTHPDRFVWFCNVDPREGNYTPKSDLESIVGFYKSIGAKGLGELTAPLYADDPMMDNLFTACENLDMPVLFHIAPSMGGCYGMVDDLGLPRLERMLKKHPKLKFIGHSTTFWAELSAGITEADRATYPTGKVTDGRIHQLMREYGNLYCDLSAGSGANALMRDPDHAARFVEEFSDRILYGSDICVSFQNYHITFDKFLDKMVEDKMISLENYEKIICKNAARILDIKI